MNLDKEKLKNFEKLPADVRREFSLLMNQYGQKKKESHIKNDFMSFVKHVWPDFCLLYTSPSPRDQRGSRMPSSA